MAQFILIICSPILTRLYSPEAFGIFTIFISITAILSVVATLRYELAIVLPEKKIDAVNVLKVTLFLNFVTFFILSLLIFINSQFHVIENTFLKDIGNFIYLIPVSVFLVCFYQALNFWFNRQKKFKNISYSKIIQSLMVCIVQLLIGWYFFGNYFGLIIGTIFGQASALLYFILVALKENQLTEQLYFDKKEIINAAYQYKRFPYWSSPGALINSISSEMPVFIITYTFGILVTGPYGLAIRVMGLPMTLISSSIYQVLVSKIAELSREDPKKLRILLSKFFVTLFIPALFIALIFSHYSIDIFVLVFGSNWAQSGEIAGIIIFAYIFKFSISPLAAVLGLKQNVHLGFYWQALYFITILITLYVASFYNFLTFIKILTIFEVAIYLIYLSFIMYGASNFTKNTSEPF